MHRSLLAAVALTGLFVLMPRNASAAPSRGLSGIHAASAQGRVTNVDYYWHHHHYHHHRRWGHHHWHYWN
jgi:hypothetical protein